MVRYRYGPWDHRYRRFLNVLVARGLMKVRTDGRTVQIDLTAMGEGLPCDKWQLKAMIAVDGGTSLSGFGARLACSHAASIPAYVIRSAFSSLEEPISKISKTIFTSRQAAVRIPRISRIRRARRANFFDMRTTPIFRSSATCDTKTGIANRESPICIGNLKACKQTRGKLAAT